MHVCVCGGSGGRTTECACGAGTDIQLDYLYMISKSEPDCRITSKTKRLCHITVYSRWENIKHSDCHFWHRRCSMAQRYVLYTYRICMYCTKYVNLST